jgi:hypothetical protein
VTNNNTDNKCGFSIAVLASDDSENHDAQSANLLERNRESDRESESDSEEPISDKIVQAYDLKANNIIEIRDSLFARKKS